VGEALFEVVGVQHQALREGGVILAKIRKPSCWGSVLTNELQGG